MLTSIKRADGSLDVSLFEDPGFTDVFRSVEVTIRVLEVSPDPKHPKHPRIYLEVLWDSIPRPQ